MKAGHLPELADLRRDAQGVDASSWREDSDADFRPLLAADEAAEAIGRLVQQSCSALEHPRRALQASSRTFANSLGSLALKPGPKYRFESDGFVFAGNIGTSVLR